jgi:hypothetical protein
VSWNRVATVEGMQPPEPELGGDRYPALGRVVRLLAAGEVEAGLAELGVLIDSDDRDLQPRAVLLLGRVNEARGNVAGMLNAYRSAAGSGHPEVAAFASFQLGLTLLDLGQTGLARRALNQAVGPSLGALMLGINLVDAEQFGPARRALKRAARARDPRVREAASAALDQLPSPRHWWQR